jgi:GNAT superfamily N-acetyltransferase
MGIRVEKTGVPEIAGLRELLRAEARCQIVRDSILGRGLADPYVIRDGDAVVGYAGVWNDHFPNRLMEFFLVDDARHAASEYFLAAVRNSGAAAAEAQTNLMLQHRLIREHVGSPVVENILFGDDTQSRIDRPDLVFRAREPDDSGPEGEWIVERGDEVVGAGGLLHHYNPPFADLFLEVIPTARSGGIGSFLVQEICRVCRETGRVPAARCDPTNIPSRRALRRGGLVEIGEIVAGPLS